MKNVTIITPHYQEETLAGDYYTITEMKHEMEDNRNITILRGGAHGKDLCALTAREYHLPVRFLAEENRDGEHNYIYFACHPLIEKYYQHLLETNEVLMARNDTLTRKNCEQHVTLRELYTLPWYKAIWFLFQKRRGYWHAFTTNRS